MSDDTDLIYTFIKPIMYVPKNSGEEIEAQFITLKEPSVKQMVACATLKQAFMRVLAKESDDADDTSESDEKVDTSEVPMENRIINALYTSDTDINKVFLSAKELFKEVGLVDGEKKVTNPLLDSMCLEDIEMMTGKYMANFILASVLKEQ